VDNVANEDGKHFDMQSVKGRPRALLVGQQEAALDGQIVNSCLCLAWKQSSAFVHPFSLPHLLKSCGIQVTGRSEAMDTIGTEKAINVIVSRFSVQLGNVKYYA